MIDMNSFGNITQCIDVQIYDSFSDETFTITLSFISTASIVVIDNDVTTIIIEDIDRSCMLSGVTDPGRGPLGKDVTTWIVTVSSNTPYSHSFNAAAEVSVPDMLSVAEDEGTVQVCATLITPFVTEFDITVRLVTSIMSQVCVYNFSV